MKITDVVMGKVALDNLLDKRKAQKQSVSSFADSSQILRKDGLDTEKKVSADMAKIREMEKIYLKDNASMEGLQNLSKRIENFQSSNEAKRSFEDLTKDLTGIVNSTKFEGESVISYLSTQIRDDKSLYTFKTNLTNEIKVLQSKLSDERKGIAFYLVKNENLDAVGRFSSDEAAKEVRSLLNYENAEVLHKGISNLPKLLGI
jgi:hypothetical protein